MTTIPDRVEVYLPICVTIDTKTGELEAQPYADYEGAPWMYVGQEADVWTVGDYDEGYEGEWITNEDLVSKANEALDKVFAHWGDS
jgi:hypothetical protein